MAPAAGLISWWRAEGDATDAVGINNGVLQGAVAFAAGEVGQAFSFNGINTDVQVPDSPSLDFASNAPMTIELWADRTGTETTMYLMGKQNTNCGSLQYEMGFNPYTGLAFTAGKGSVATAIQMPTNTWMHLAATYDGTNTFQFYINGALAATGSGNLGPPNSAPLVIGNSSICAGFAGLIDEISIYSNALSAAAIQSIYAAGSSGKCFTPPSITNQPQSQTVLVGETVAFSVAASGGTPPYTYQWQMNSTNISGATNNTLVLTNVQSSQSSSYSVIVRGVGSSAVSSNALLTVVTPVPGVVEAPDQAGLLAGMAAGGNVTFAVDGTIVLSQTVVVTQNTVLDAGGHTVTISGNGAVGIFSVSSGIHFTLKNLTISNGFNQGAAGSDGAGGGLYNNAGMVDVVQCSFVGNAALGGAGGNGQNGGNASGGAIYNNLGLLNITNSSFTSNNATGGAVGNGGTTGGSSYGGAICNQGGTVNLVAGTFAGNSSLGGFGSTNISGTAFGGALHNNGGSLNVIGATFTGNNSSSGSAGASFSYAGPLAACGGSLGGAMSTIAGNVTVVNGNFYLNNATSPVAGNYATAGQASGGAIYQASGTLNLTATIVATNGVFGGSGAGAYPTNFPANGYGGGVFNAGIFNSTNCNFYGNTASGGGTDLYPGIAGNGYGGAIANEGAANLSETTLAGNQAIGGLGGVLLFGGERRTVLPSGNGSGGGIFNSNVVLLLGCSVSGNAAVGLAAIAQDGYNDSGRGGNANGGGIFNLGVCFSTNDTVVGNSATGGSPGSGEFSTTAGSANGGGLFNQGGTVTLDYVTISSNSAIGGVGAPSGVGVGGGINATNGSLLLLDSIVALNPSGSDFYSSFGAITDGGDNLSSDLSFPFSAPGSSNNVNPELGPLGNYGGPTPTVPLLPGSPAIDAAGAGGCPATDQRGVPKPIGGACDIGAFEYAPSFSIQGQVQSNGLAGIISVSAGIWSSVVNSQGNYVLSNVVAGSYSVIPSSSNPGVVFSPMSQTVSVGPSATNVNFIASPSNTPLLMLSNTAPNLLVLSWPTNAVGAYLQMTTNLASTNWATVSGSVVVGNQNVVTTSLSGASAFFRLK
ncbi:MAG TPA: LamG-like jellyroll fold domain-containing protein [Candidatus Saccharimonadales bacterium]|nr:LamG-like jellyroll fold domain-containing protein [Candidatus Saccharimonadales bacterium]